LAKVVWEPGFPVRNVRAVTSTACRRIAVGDVGLGKGNPKPRSWERVSPGGADTVVAGDQIVVEADEGIGMDKG